MKLKENVGEQYEIDISPIQNDGEEMLSFQEMLEEVLEHAGMDDILERIHVLNLWGFSL